LSRICCAAARSTSAWRRSSATRCCELQRCAVRGGRCAVARGSILVGLLRVPSVRALRRAQPVARPGRGCRQAGGLAAGSCNPVRPVDAFSDSGSDQPRRIACVGATNHPRDNFKAATMSS
jgi:hypothetical protein